MRSFTWMFRARESKIRQIFSCVSLSRCNIRWLRLRLRNNTSGDMCSCCLLYVKIRDLRAFLSLLVIPVVLNVFSRSIHTRCNFAGRNIDETPNETKFLCDSQNPAMSPKIAQGRDNPTRKTQRNIGDARSEVDREEERERERWTRKYTHATVGRQIDLHSLVSYLNF